jgi:uncharacterized membrane protein
MAVNTKSLDVRKMTYLAILTAIVFVLQLLGGGFKVGVFSFTFVLVPIVIGAALCGIYAGAWLGFVFGLAVFVTGDAALFLEFHIVGTIVTVLFKGTLAGLCAGIAYKALERLNRYLAVFVAAVVCPIVNSGIFFLGGIVFFLDSIEAYFNAPNGPIFIITGLIGINFFVELAINIVLAPVILSIINIKKPVSK